MNDDNQNQNNSGGIFGSPMNINSTVHGDDSSVSQNTQQSIHLENTESQISPRIQEDLSSVGVTFVDDSKENTEELNIFSQNSSFKNKEQEAVNTVIQNQKIEIQPEKSKVPVKMIEDVPTQELEDDFSKTFSNDSASKVFQDSSEDHLKIEEERLKNIHKELKEKAASKKVVVKERLEKLRKEKESLGKELEEIKELEAIALKIEEKLKALESIDNEIDSLENKAKEELL